MLGCELLQLCLESAFSTAYLLVSSFFGDSRGTRRGALRVSYVTHPLSTLMAALAWRILTVYRAEFGPWPLSKGMLYGQGQARRLFGRAHDHDNIILLVYGWPGDRGPRVKMTAANIKSAPEARRA